MNTKVRGIITRSTFTSFWATALSLITIVIAPYAMADTAANTQINNHVTVYYSSENDTGSYFAEADVTVTVSLVAAAPTIDYPSDITDSTESTIETLTYTITGNANGLDDYEFSIINFSNTGLIGGSYSPTGVVTIPIGGTTLAADATTPGQMTITVPYDGTLDGIANGIEAGDTIIIGGDTYQVETTGTPISENESTNLTTITLQSGISGAGGSAGDLVRERVTVDVAVTTGTLSGMSGSHAVNARVTWDGSTNIDQGTPTVITIGRPSLIVSKYVRDTTPSAPPGTVEHVYGGVSYYEDVNASPGATLEYIIVVENPEAASGGLTANSVVIEDFIPQFTSYVLGSMGLDPDGDGIGFASIGDASNDNDPGEWDSGSNRVFIYVGIGGTDTGTGTYGDGDGTGGTLAAGITAIGRFQVTID
jgi:uncharacterized repeat protein (TIGR01451 family)